MSATQLFLDFTEPHSASVKTVAATIIGFPVQPKSSDRQERGEEQSFSDNDFTSFAPYGSWVDYGRRLAPKERLRVNNEAVALLSKQRERLSLSELDTLRAYSGWGGLSVSGKRGVLYDYYTSPPIAALVWKLLDRIGPIKKNAAILEPSCGTGVFLATAPSCVSCTGVELDKNTAEIASRLHTEATIIHKSYEAFNVSGGRGNGYDHAIGNIPFGGRTLETAFMDMPNEKSLDRYFIGRSLDNLKPCGTMALIAHSGILANKSNADWRLDINRKARFMGAVKLNDRSFGHTHTAIQPDILLFGKHPEDVLKELQTLPTREMGSSGYAQKEWIDGTYFSERRNHVMGTTLPGNGRWKTDVVSGFVTPEALESILGNFKPEPSVLDWEHNGSGKTAEPRKQSETVSALLLTEEETKAVESKNLRKGSVKTIDAAVCILSENYRWIPAADDRELAERIDIILPLSESIRSIRRRMREKTSAAEFQDAAKSALAEYNDRYGGYPKDDKIVGRFLRGHPAVRGIYDALVEPDADILSVSSLYDESGVPVNGHNRAVEVLLFLQQRMLPADPDTVGQYFPDENGELTAEMYRNPDIFLSENGAWQLREDFVSGNIRDKLETINALIAGENDKRKTDKWNYGIGELEKAVGWIPIEDADFSPHSSWIPEEIINAWIGDADGLCRSDCLRLGRLSKNETGKWGIRYVGDHSIYDRNARDYRQVLNGEWEPYADEIVDLFRNPHWFPNKSCIFSG